MQKQSTSELYRQVRQKMETEKSFRLKFGTFRVPEDDTTLYASICDGANIVAYTPIMRNLYVTVQKNSVTIVLPEVS